MLGEMAAVEPGEPVGIGRKVARHPVEQHAEAVLVAALDEALEIRRRAEPAGRGIEPDRLVAPRAVERVLADRHQQIGRASCRERGWQYGWISVVAALEKKQK